MKRLELFFDSLFSAIANILMSLIRRLAKFVVAIPPAWYWGEVIYRSSNSLFVGVSAAIVLEIGGMLSASYAVAYHGTSRGKLAAGLTGAYLLIGVGVMWGMTSVDSSTKLVTTAVFGIAAMVYLLTGMAELEQNEQQATHEAEQERARRDEADKLRLQQIEDREAEHQQKMDIAKLKLKHEKDMAKIEAEARKAKAQAKANESKPTKIETLAKADDLSGSALLVFEALRRNPDATNVEIAKSLPITPQRVGQIKKQLNGAVKQ